MQQSSSQSVPAKRPDKDRAGHGQGASEQAFSASSSSEIVGHVFQQYNESLVRYLTVRLCSLSDAEEVAQEAYARMLGLDKPDTIGHLQAYLFKIASNIAIDRIRKRSRQPQHLPLDGVSEGIAAPAAAVDRVVEARERLLLIRNIVAELPPKCRKAFLLYKFNGSSYREIADQMQLTESMIRKYVLRAIVYCRSRLDDESIEGQ